MNTIETLLTYGTFATVALVIGAIVVGATIAIVAGIEYADNLKKRRTQ